MPTGISRDEQLRLDAAATGKDLLSPWREPPVTNSKDEQQRLDAAAVV